MIVNENSTSRFTMRPLNENGDAFTPTNARWRLDDVTSGNEVKSWQTIGTPSTEMEVQIDAADNGIIDEAVSEEDKVFTFETDFGTVSAHIEEVVYTVRNMTSPAIT